MRILRLWLGLGVLVVALGGLSACASGGGGCGAGGCGAGKCKGCSPDRNCCDGCRQGTGCTCAR